MTASKITTGPMILHLSTVAAREGFELPVCADCGTVQYPLREICGNCLSYDLSWQEVESGGVIQAITVLHHSTQSRFRDRLPLLVGSIKLDCGPVCIAFLGSSCDRPGLRVTVRFIFDDNEFPVPEASLQTE